MAAQRPIIAAMAAMSEHAMDRQIRDDCRSCMLKKGVCVSPGGLCDRVCVCVCVYVKEGEKCCVRVCVFTCVCVCMCVSTESKLKVPPRLALHFAFCSFLSVIHKIGFRTLYKFGWG